MDVTTFKNGRYSQDHLFASSWLQFPECFSNDGMLLKPSEVCSREGQSASVTAAAEL